MTKPVEATDLVDAIRRLAENRAHAAVGATYLPRNTYVHPCKDKRFIDEMKKLLFTLATPTASTPVGGRVEDSFDLGRAAQIALDELVNEFGVKSHFLSLSIFIRRVSLKAVRGCTGRLLTSAISNGAGLDHPQAAATVRKADLAGIA